MKSINLISLFLILLNIIPVYSQDNADYFPCKKDNYWEYYWNEIFYPDTIVSLSIFDTTDNEGRKIAIFDSYFINPIRPPALLPDSGVYIIDSRLNVFSNNTLIGGGCNQEYLLTYKLNGKQGDQWVVCDVGGDGYRYEMARIREIKNDVILGVPTKTMWVEYYLAEDSTDTTGLVRGGDVLAKGFGLQGRTGEGWPGVILKGAVIDGVLYGDTTKIITNVNYYKQNQPDKFVLYQNYPNPFNPITIIKFNLSSGGNISLIVYNTLGREVVRLIDDEYYSPGEFEKNWNGRDAGQRILSSGIYFYRLLYDKNYEKTKAMILIK